MMIIVRESVNPVLEPIFIPCHKTKPNKAEQGRQHRFKSALQPYPIITAERSLLRPGGRVFTAKKSSSIATNNFNRKAIIPSSHPTKTHGRRGIATPTFVLEKVARMEPRSSLGPDEDRSLLVYAANLECLSKDRIRTKGAQAQPPDLRELTGLVRV